MPSSAGLDKPVRENVWFSAEEIPRTAAGATGADGPTASGEGELIVPPGPVLMPEGLLGVLPPVTLPVARGVSLVFPLPAFPLGATPPVAGLERQE
jgi:hypothetical protein